MKTGDTGSETSVSATRGKLLYVMRDEKEKRKKQARSNHRSIIIRPMVKQTNKAKQFNMYRYERTCTCMSV